MVNLKSYFDAAPLLPVHNAPPAPATAPGTSWYSFATSGIQAAPPQRSGIDWETCGMPMTQRYVAFGIIILFSAVCIFLVNRL